MTKAIFTDVSSADNRPALSREYSVHRGVERRTMVWERNGELSGMTGELENINNVAQHKLRM